MGFFFVLFFYIHILKAEKKQRIKTISSYKGFNQVRGPPVRHSEAMFYGLIEPNWKFSPQFEKGKNWFKLE